MSKESKHESTKYMEKIKQQNVCFIGNEEVVTSQYKVTSQ